MTLHAPSCRDGKEAEGGLLPADQAPRTSAHASPTHRPHDHDSVRSALTSTLNIRDKLAYRDVVVALCTLLNLGNREPEQSRTTRCRHTSNECRTQETDNSPT